MYGRFKKLYIKGGGRTSEYNAVPLPVITSKQDSCTRRSILNSHPCLPPPSTNSNNSLNVFLFLLLSFISLLSHVLSLFLFYRRIITARINNNTSRKHKAKVDFDRWPPPPNALTPINYKQDSTYVLLFLCPY